ncbi:MAG: hypothetical protein J6W30_02805 [Bacteroidales bacterium]|nr:hypothetical protein [Bacteroidales bacterium]
MQLTIKNTLSLQPKIQIMKNGNQTIESEREGNHVVDGVPCTYSIEEAKAMVLERGRKIKAGYARMIPHDEAMREIEQWLASYAD